MKRLKNDAYLGKNKIRCSHILIGLGLLYLIFIAFKFPLVLEVVDMLEGNEAFTGTSDIYHEDSMSRNTQIVTQNKEGIDERKSVNVGNDSGLLVMGDMREGNVISNGSVLEQMADEAWTLGLKSWNDIIKFRLEDDDEQSLPVVEGTSEPCSSWVSMSGEELVSCNSIMLLPCGLAAGSSITVIGTPQYAHPETVPRVGKLRIGDDTDMVSQFVVELQGLKSVDGEDPPKVFHLNPRLKGDWSQHPVIEHNACYRMQWGKAQRCDGLPSEKDGDMLGNTDFPLSNCHFFTHEFTEVVEQTDFIPFVALAFYENSHCDFQFFFELWFECS